MPGRYGSSAVTITLDDAPNGTPRIITGFVMELCGAKIVVDREDSNGFGEAWALHCASGIRRVEPIPVSGHFNTSGGATAPHTVFMPGSADADPNAGTRTLVLVFGDGKTFTVECLLSEYEVAAENNKLTTFNALLTPTGAGVWT